jgi:hypothetical protein
MDEINFVVLDVGQGQGNFIGIYKNGVLTNTILMDLGYFLRSKVAALESVSQVQIELNTMANPTIDLIILSHSDYDHVSLICKLLDGFTPPGGPPVVGKQTLTVGAAYYSGEHGLYNKKSCDVLGTIKQYFADINQDPEPLVVNSSSFYAPAPTPVWESVDEIDLYLLAANTTIPGRTRLNSRRSAADTGRPDGYLINTSSLVVLMRYKDVGFLITGDATGITMARCNEILEKQKIGQLFKDIFMMTLPHHGSSNSAFELKGLTPDPDPKKSNKVVARKVLTNFAQYINPQCITTSADMIGSYKHPSATVINYFAGATRQHTPYYKDTRLGNDLHFFTAYFLLSEYEIDTGGTHKTLWPPKSAWFTVQTKANIYSNLYFLAGMQGDAIWPAAQPSVATAYTGAPRSLGVAWQFQVDEHGGKAVGPTENRQLLLATVMPFPAIPHAVPAQATAHGGGRTGLPAMARLAPGHFAQPFVRPPSPRADMPAGLRGLRAIP